MEGSRVLAKVATQNNEVTWFIVDYAITYRAEWIILILSFTKTLQLRCEMIMHILNEFQSHLLILSYSAL